MGYPDKKGSTNSDKVSLEDVFFSDFHSTKKKLKRMQHVARGRVSGLKHHPEKALRIAAILRYCSLTVRIHSYRNCIPASVASEILFFVPAQISC